jgi:hypothetical protein
MVTETLLRDLKPQTLSPFAGSTAAQKASALRAAVDPSIVRQLSSIYTLLSPSRDFARRENLPAKDFCDKRCYEGRVVAGLV